MLTALLAQNSQSTEMGGSAATRAKFTGKKRPMAWNRVSGWKRGGCGSVLMHRGQEVRADYGSRCARDGLGSDARDVRVVARKTDLGAGATQTAVEKGAARLTGGARVSAPGIQGFARA
jgi:hypothetical protein